ncbi:hypothetical protein [Helicobacter sp. T3_23-1056]
MKKLSLVILVAVLSIAFVACGDSKDSKDLGESQKSTQDSQVESSDLVQDSTQSNAQSSESTTENIICKESNSTVSQMICKEVSVIDFYSNEDSDIFYDKKLVDSIKLTDTQKSILNPAVMYIFDDKSVALGVCRKSCDFRKNVGILTNFYAIQNTKNLFLSFDKELALESLAWQLYKTNADNFLPISCRNVPCEISLESMPQNSYLQAIFTTPKYRIQVVWNFAVAR